MQVKKRRKEATLYGAKTSEAVIKCGWSDLTVRRQHRSLKRLLPEPVGKKSMNNGHRRLV